MVSVSRTNKAAITLAALGGVVALWVLVNNPDSLRAGVIYVAMAVLVIAIYGGVLKK